MPLKTGPEGAGASACCLPAVWFLGSYVFCFLVPGRLGSTTSKDSLLGKVDFSWTATRRRRCEGQKEEAVFLLSPPLPPPCCIFFFFFVSKYLYLVFAVFLPVALQKLFFFVLTFVLVMLKLCIYLKFAFLGNSCSENSVMLVSLETLVISVCTVSKFKNHSLFVFHTAVKDGRALGLLGWIFRFVKQVIQLGLVGKSQTPNVDLFHVFYPFLKFWHLSGLLFFFQS